ncbi:hypothetical protein Dsin_023138 [Dipteronia sinensis]|uniref:RNase H type-1 domain-containing protein n=1 Tax=Dipteronia sinensis TaxID=43782 RepID=A0AAE0A2P9_9ROSI|nr:hypothetical protein Dsin_023138 [Dipteronia sinensis]
MYNLWFCRISVVDIYPLCRKVSETTLHALWDCKMFKSARLQWIPTNSHIRGGGTTQNSRGIQFSKDCGLCPCYVESDAEVVVRWINEGSHLDSMCGTILADIHLMSSKMSGMCFMFAPRQANQVAHFLAKHALRCIDDRFWMEEFPSCVTIVVQLDMPG